MGVEHAPVPVLTPVSGIKYKTKEDALSAYLKGAPFVCNLAGHPFDGCLVTITTLFYSVVKLQFGAGYYFYEGN